jgi:hypothetical protein
MVALLLHHGWHPLEFQPDHFSLLPVQQHQPDIFCVMDQRFQERHTLHYLAFCLQLMVQETEARLSTYRILEVECLWVLEQV